MSINSEIYFNFIDESLKLKPYAQQMKVNIYRIEI